MEINDIINGLNSNNSGTNANNNVVVMVVESVV